MIRKIWKIETQLLRINCVINDKKYFCFKKKNSKLKLQKNCVKIKSYQEELKNDITLGHVSKSWALIPRVSSTGHYVLSSWFFFF